jgi:hypothetical protein
MFVKVSWLQCRLHNRYDLTRFALYTLTLCHFSHIGFRYCQGTIAVRGRSVSGTMLRNIATVIVFGSVGIPLKPLQKTAQGTSDAVEGDEEEREC